MRIAVPTMGYGGLGEEVGEHFGRVPTYTIVDLSSDEVEVIDNTSEHRGGDGLPPQIIDAAGAQVMLVRGLGRRAISLFGELGIDVYVGARGTVKDAVEMYRREELELATLSDGCDHDH